MSVTGQKTREPLQTFGASEPQHVLYLSIDGLLSAIGQSQIVAYLERLSGTGFKYHVLTLERSDDLQQAAQVQRLQDRLTNAGISWTWIPYSTTAIRPLRIASNLFRFFLRARRIIAAKRMDVIHARSYPPAMIAWLLRKKTPYLFDMRGAWIDECREAGRGFNSGLTYAVGKRWETLLVRYAAGVITLTSTQQADVKDAADTHATITVIPTCTDFETFSIAASAALPLALRVKISGRKVFGFVGSLNAAYHVKETLALFCAIRKFEPQAFLLCLTSQASEMNRALSAAGIAPQDFAIHTVPHDQMPKWLHLLDWGFLLLTNSPARRGAVPTKLAEFFASGVRPIVYGGNEEIADYTHRAQSGIVLKSLLEEALIQAAQQILHIKRDEKLIASAREKMRQEFSVESGAKLYASALDAIVGRSRA